ncbi:hypothetical protein VNO78_18609 [Psophocarpus tetragonolobus]|uniref:Uncharacterized protein n=1 Tax=Psophocarpus tetragonolobus TaxID=3891 RepID=A0AAN9XLP4_PSOTE
MITSTFLTMTSTSISSMPMPLSSPSLIEFVDDLSIGCTVNHVITDDASFWNLFNIFAQVNRGATNCIRNISYFHHESVLISYTVLRLSEGSPQVMSIMAVSCYHRIEPKLEPYYFEDVIQSVPTYTFVGEVLSRDLRWCTEKKERAIELVAISAAHMGIYNPEEKKA